MHLPEDSEQRLVQLLSLKRHEVPPPGFFDQLPSRILVNLRAGSEVPETPWWSRVWRAIAQEPMVGLSYAALGVGAVLFGISVLETAVDVHGTPSAPSAVHGMLPPPAHTAEWTVYSPPGMEGSIYRVADPGSSLGLQPAPLPIGSPLSPFARPEHFELVPVHYYPAVQR